MALSRSKLIFGSVLFGILISVTSFAILSELYSYLFLTPADDYLIRRAIPIGTSLKILFAMLIGILIWNMVRGVPFFLKQSLNLLLVGLFLGFLKLGFFPERSFVGAVLGILSLVSILGSIVIHIKYKKYTV